MTEVPEQLRPVIPPNTLVVISAPSTARASNMLMGLGALRDQLLDVRVDLSGDWLRHVCGVDTSPCVLRVTSNTIDAAYVFDSVQALERIVNSGQLSGSSEFTENSGRQVETLPNT